MKLITIIPKFVKVKEEHVIEEVTPQIIDALKEDEEYVAVFFAGECADEACKGPSTYDVRFACALGVLSY